MDLTCLNADETMEVLRGWRAAKGGAPFDPHETSLWIEGWRMTTPTQPPKTLSTSAMCAAE